MFRDCVRNRLKKILSIVIISVTLLMIIGIGINENRDIHNKRFYSVEDMEETVKDLNKKEVYEFLCSFKDSNNVFVFIKDEDSIYNYRFVKNNNGSYRFLNIEAKPICIINNENNLSETLSVCFADSISRVESDSNVVTCWGITGNKEVNETTANGKKIDKLVKFEYNNSDCYLYVVSNIDISGDIKKIDIGS